MGGYSQQIVVDERFAVRIPDALELDVAAPLLCAGITLYTPAEALGRRPRQEGRHRRHGRPRPHGRQDRHGHGRRGHRAQPGPVQGGGRPPLRARRLPRDQRTAAIFEDLRGQFDLIISTIGADFDVDAYLSLLQPFGAFVSVGLPPEAQSAALRLPRPPATRSWPAPTSAASTLTQEMLDFCAEHGIGAEIEKISADEVNDAYDRVVGSDVRYRFVIDTATIPSAS